MQTNSIYQNWIVTIITTDTSDDQTVLTCKLSVNDVLSFPAAKLVNTALAELKDFDCSNSRLTSQIICSTATLETLGCSGEALNQ